MDDELSSIATTPDQTAYLSEIERRARRGTLAVRARYSSIQLSWIIVLLAGAAIALVDVFELSTRFAAVLGFVVVVFQGIERIFDRTSTAAQADDVLRRTLRREQRMALARTGPYADAEDTFDVFAERCEKVLGEHDATMVDCFATLARSSDPS